MSLVKVINFFKQGDLFGGQFHFTMGGGDTVKTLFGFFLTVSFYLGFAGCCAFFLSDFFDSSSVDSQTSKIIQSSHPRQDINSDRLVVLFLVKNGSKFIEPSNIPNFTDLYFTEDNYKKQKGGSAFDFPIQDIRKMAFIPCKNMAWYKDFSNQNLTKEEKVLFDAFAICPEATEIQIKGGDSDSEKMELSLRAGPSKTASGLDIATLKELEVWPMVFASYYQASVIDQPLSYEKIYSFRHRIASQMQKEIVFSIGEMIVRSNGGLFGSEYQVDTGSYIESVKTSTSVTSSASSTSLLISLRSSNLVTEHNRVYTSLFTLISNIGGVAEIIVFIITILYSPVNQYFSDKNLIRFGIMKKLDKTSLLENEGDEEDPESYTYENTFKLSLINKKIKAPKNLVESRQAHFLKETQKLARERCDIYNVIKNLNELIFLRNLFFTKAHRKLASTVGLTLLDSFNENLEEKSQNNMSISDAIEMLERKENENAVQKEISEIFHKAVKKDEKEFKEHYEDVVLKRMQTKTQAKTKNDTNAATTPNIDHKQNEQNNGYIKATPQEEMKIQPNTKLPFEIEHLEC